MILYDFSCPIDGLMVDHEDTPLAVKGPQTVAVGKHLHLDIDQTFSCENGHTFTLQGSLLLNRSA